MHAGDFEPAQLTLFTARPCLCCPLASRCPARRTTRSCSDDPVAGLVDPTRTDFINLLAELGGLELSTTRARRQLTPTLPDFVPQVDGTAASSGVRSPWVLVNLGVWRRRAGIVRRRLDLSMRQRLNLPDDTRIVLVLFGKDALLDGEVWPRRGDLIDAIGVWRPDLVVAPDFSVWQGDPWLSQRVSIVRSLRLFERLQDAGVPAVPHVYWASRSDVEDWAAWLRTNRVDMIAVDLQCIGLGLRRYLTELATFRAMLDRPPVLFINGMRPGARMRMLQAIWPESVFTADLLRLAAKRRTLVLRPDDSVGVASRPGVPPRVLYSEMIELALRYGRPTACQRQAS